MFTEIRTIISNITGVPAPAGTFDDTQAPLCDYLIVGVPSLRQVLTDDTQAPLRDDIFACEIHFKLFLILN